MSDLFGRQDEQYVLSRAYVPEHIVSLMQAISGGRPFLLEDYLGYVRDNWLIFVGYPLESRFTAEQGGTVVERAIETYRPEYLWFIGPAAPPALSEAAQQNDQYLRLDVERFKPKSALRRIVRKAAETLRVERAAAYTPAHKALVAEFMARQDLPPMVAELYRAMPDYLAQTTTACALNAWDRVGNLSAFYVVEMAAHTFDTYVLGCYSKKHYTPHASDLLFFEMIKLARERDKKIINLGLGVNEGITRFKKKWGGEPFLTYQFCERHYPRSTWHSMLRMLLERNL